MKYFYYHFIIIIINFSWMYYWIVQWLVSTDSHHILNVNWTLVHREEMYGTALSFRHLSLTVGSGLASRRVPDKKQLLFWSSGMVGNRPRWWACEGSQWALYSFWIDLSETNPNVSTVCESADVWYGDKNKKSNIYDSDKLWPSDRETLKEF